MLLLFEDFPLLEPEPDPDTEPPRFEVALPEVYDLLLPEFEPPLATDVERFEVLRVTLGFDELLLFANELFLVERDPLIDCERLLLFRVALIDRLLFVVVLTDPRLVDLPRLSLIRDSLLLVMLLFDLSVL